MVSLNRIFILFIISAVTIIGYSWLRVTNIPIYFNQRLMVRSSHDSKMSLSMKTFNSKDKTVSNNNPSPTVEKKFRLETQEGARPLTPNELKLKEKFDISSFSDVKRIHSPESRVPLSALKAGQKMKGRIISVTEFGIYVDVGSKKDGLVHIKDVSRDYFIENIESKFTPGQDIDVWVKFADENKYKLGLQMFPVITNISSNKKIQPISNFLVGKNYTGIVTRVSNHGVYVNIGTSVEAYLHKRKMKTTRKLRSLKPWEIVPMGSKINAYIYEVDPIRERISLTTYPPSDWATKLPDKKVTTNSMDSMTDDEEELGGSVRADNIRALQRTLAINIDNDENDDVTDEEFEEGEELSENEIQVIMDDFGGKKGKQSPLSSSTITSTTSTSTTNDDMDTEEVSVDEMFNELANGKSFVTISDLQKWDFINELMRNGELDEGGLRDLVKEAGGVNGKLKASTFDVFFDILSEELDMEVLEEDDDDDEVVNQTKNVITSSTKGGITLLPSLTDIPPSNNNADTVSSSSSSISYSDADDEDEEDELLDLDDLEDGIKPPPQVVAAAAAAKSTATSSIPSSKGKGFSTPTHDTSPVSKDTQRSKPITTSSSSTPTSSNQQQQSLGLDDLYTRKSDTNDIFKYVFTSVAGKKGYITYPDILAWDLVKALLSSGTIKETYLQSLYNKCLSRKKKELDIQGFNKFVDEITNIDSSTIRNLNDDTTENIPTMSPSSPTKPHDSSMTSSKQIDVEDDIEVQDISIEDFFNELSQGKKTVPLKTFLASETIQEIMSELNWSVKDINEKMLELGIKNNKLNQKQVGDLLDILIGDESADDYDDDAEEEEEKVEVKTKDKKQEKVSNGKSDIINNQRNLLSELSSSLDNVSDKIIMRQSTGAEDSKKAEVEEAEAEEGGDDDDDDDDDDESYVYTDEIFNELSQGKGYVTAEDLLTVEIVQELIEDARFTVEEFKALCKQKGGGENKLDLEQFDELFELIVPLAEGDEDGDGDEEEEEVFLEDAFNELSNGKDTVTINKLLAWEDIQNIISDGGFTAEQFKEFCVQAGAVRNKLDYPAFESLMDIMSEYTDKIFDIDEPLDEYEDDDEEEEEEEVQIDPADRLLNSLGKSYSSRDKFPPNNNDDTTSSSSNGGGSSNLPILLARNNNNNIGVVDMGDIDDDEAADRQILEAVFNSLRGPKAKVAPKDLMNWDFVLDMMMTTADESGNFVLSEDYIKGLMSDCGADEKGVDLNGFSILVDKLVDFYAEYEDHRDLNSNTGNSNEEGGDEEDSDLLALKDIRNKHNIEQDDIGEYVELDTEIVFEEVAKGKSYATVNDVKQWDLLVQLKKDGMMTDKDIEDMLEEAGAVESDQIDVIGFELFLELLEGKSEEDN